MTGCGTPRSSVWGGPKNWTVHTSLPGYGWIRCSGIFSREAAEMVGQQNEAQLLREASNQEPVPKEDA